ncbi:MAG TPA: homoserine O-succinyltransferase [Egicoccus sp.]|nr:homoserine O-succinyltransferase [Egicoccus sp.]HSK25102.1 homoserine O-succinyltransferase [Egicoccus sp.]
MPIVAHSALPTFAELAAAGEDVLDVEQAQHADIRELHVGLLNMMPDAALHVTEQQFIRLVGHANRIVQVYVHPFTVPGLVRSDAARAHIERYYTPFEQLREDGLDALIVSGANVSNPRLDEEAFWTPLLEVIDWASDNVTSVLCSCLATHALLQYLHGIHRRPLLSKRWGVFQHRASRPDHPLLRGINSRFDVPHSRWNEVTSAQLEAQGLQVLIESTEADFHLGTSADGIRMVFMQGHPEYDTVSLLKEYKREVTRYSAGELDELPPLPQHYFHEAAARLAHRHLEAVVAARDAGRPAPPFPEVELAADLDNTWADTAKAVFANWLGLVYRLTDIERGAPFMPGVDPDDPLGLRAD